MAPTKTVPSPLDTARDQRLDRVPDRYLRRLIRISYEFNSTLELEVLLPRILENILDTLDAEAGSIWTVEDERVYCRYALGPVADQIIGLELPVGAGIVGDVVATGNSALVADPQSDARFLHQVDEATGFRTHSLVAVPLITRGETVGAIQVVNPRSGEAVDFGEEHLLFLEALADDAAAAIRNGKLFEAEKRARDLKALLEVSHEITSTFDLERVLVSIVNLAGRAVRFERCVLALWEEEQLRVRAISGEERLDRKSAAVRELERFLLWAAERGEALHVPDTSDADDEHARQLVERFPRYLEDSGTHGLLLLPVEDAEGKLGVMLFEFGTPNILEEWTREAAALLANEAALALRNAQLYRGVPFISWLEPLAQKRRVLAALPGAAWARYGMIALAVLAVLALARWPLRVRATGASVRAAVQRPAHAGIGGLVEAVWVREGQRVEAGAPIADLRDDELLRSVRETESGLERSRREALAADARGDAAAAALARVRVAELTDALALLRRRVAAARVVAPAAGVVLTPRIEEKLGSFVAMGAPIAWIGDPAWSELELRIRQEDLGEIELNDRVRARVSAYPSVTFEGRVIAIAPRADTTAATPTYTLRAVLDNRQELLRPGMEARARVVTGWRPLGVLLFRRPWRWLRMHFWW